MACAGVRVLLALAVGHRSPLAIFLVLASASAFAACGSAQTSGSSPDAAPPPDAPGPSGPDAAVDAPAPDGGDATLPFDARPGDAADASNVRDATSADADAGPPGSGALDPSFGEGGIAVSPPVTPLPEAGAVVEQVARSVVVSDTGAIVVAGWASLSFTLGGPDQQVAVWRFLPSGAPDTSFGHGAVFTTGDTSHVPSEDVGWSVCLDAQNRAIVAGSSIYDVGSSTYLPDMALWRLTSSGSLDTTFGTNGHVLGFFGPPDSGTYESSTASTVACTSGASVGGSSFYAGPTVWSLTSGGSFDTSGFGAPNGWVGDPSLLAGAVNALAMDDAGRSIAVGSAGTDSGVATGAVVWRRTPAGALDTTFAGGGRDVLADLDASVDAGGLASGALTGIAIDSTSDLVVSIGQPPGVARLTSQGSLDTTFGASGYVALPLPSRISAANVSAFTAGIGLDSKGRILVLGNVASASETVSYMTVWRLTGTGALDASFGVGGVVTFTGAVGGTYDVAHGIAIDAQDRPVVVGESMAPGGALAPRSAVVWRLLP